MTDVMSEAFGRELVARTAFEKEAIWLPLLAVHHLNAGAPIITGKTFTECVLEGPAVIAAMPGTIFDSCDMGAVQDPHSLLFKAQGPKLVGVIGFKDCNFVRCRFRQVGFSGHDDFVEAMKTDLAPVGTVRA
jgi:hypothetical protein